jgi:hypothetical protein
MSFNFSAFESYCDYHGLAADPEVYGADFNDDFVGEIDIEEYLKCQIEDRIDIPEDVKCYLDYDAMAKDALGNNGGFFQEGKYLFHKS